MRLDPNLVAYSALTLLGLAWLAERFDPSPLPGDGCRISYVYDGDTVGLICPEGESRGRLIGIDAPELSEPRCEAERLAALASRDALRAMVGAASRLRVEKRGHDRYRRDLILIWLDGEEAGARLMRDGHARPYDGGRRQGWCG